MSDLAMWRELIYDRLVALLPAVAAARVDELRPSLRIQFGGALNGQRERRRIVLELLHEIGFERIIETGTFRGGATEFFSNVSGLPVDTVELQPRYFHYARRRLARYPDVTTVLGDSRSLLRRLADPRRAGDQTVFIYLDAHWEEDLPLPEELEIIATSWPRAVVMVDDFQVPDDPGYGYDDYGPGKRFTEDILPATALMGWGRYYPTAPSSAETGTRRGCIFLVSPSLCSEVDAVKLLRRAR